MIIQCLWLNSDKLRVMSLHTERDVFVFYSKTSEHFNPRIAAEGSWAPCSLRAHVHLQALALGAPVHYTEEGNAVWEMLLYSLLRMGGEVQNDLLNL